MGQLRPGSVELVFDRDVRIDVIHKAVALAVREHGCTECGMNGIDVVMRVQDPVFEKFKGVKGLVDLKFYR